MGIRSTIKDVVKAAPKASVLGTVAVVGMPVIAVTSNIAPMGFDSLGTFFANNAAFLGFIAAALVALGSIAYVVSSNGKGGSGGAVKKGAGNGAGVRPELKGPSHEDPDLSKRSSVSDNGEKLKQGDGADPSNPHSKELDGDRQGASDEHDYIDDESEANQGGLGHQVITDKIAHFPASLVTLNKSNKVGLTVPVLGSQAQVSEGSGDEAEFKFD